jgi:hypothetical protein
MTLLDRQSLHTASYLDKGMGKSKGTGEGQDRVVVKGRETVSANLKVKVM